MFDVPFFKSTDRVVGFTKVVESGSLDQMIEHLGSIPEISLATAQQQSASEQVVETMRDIADVARQSAAGARQMAESASLLTTIAGRLHGITQIYYADQYADTDGLPSRR